jgi:hypothetical protein
MDRRAGNLRRRSRAALVAFGVLAGSTLWPIAGASAQVRQPIASCNARSDLLVGRIGAPSCTVTRVCDVEPPATQCQADGGLTIRGLGAYRAEGTLTVDGIVRQSYLSHAVLPSPLFIDTAFGPESFFAPNGSTMTATCRVLGTIGINNTLRCELYGDPN